MSSPMTARASIPPSESTAFNTSGGKSRSAGSATARKIANGTPLLRAHIGRRSGFPCRPRPLPWRGAAPPWRRRSGPERQRPRIVRQRRARAALTRRCASDAVTASSVLTAPSSETISEPRMRSPGRSRGSSPPHRPQLTTSDGLRLAASASRARKVDASPQSVVRPGPARIAASRFSPQTIRTFADDGKRLRRLASG